MSRGESRIDQIRSWIIQILFSGFHQLSVGRGARAVRVSTSNTPCGYSNRSNYRSENEEDTAEDSGRSRDDSWQISRTASEVLRPRGRRRYSDHLFGMGNPGAGPRWLAKARYQSAIQHWNTAAVATSVRHQIDTRGEAEVPGAACPGD